MKKLKFASDLVPLVLSGEKTSTWRLFDDKDLRIEDELVFINSETDEEFARARITRIREKKLGEITETDFDGHERFENLEKMYRMYRDYYGNRVTPYAVVKMIDFQILNKG